MDCWCWTSAPGVAQGLPWGPRGTASARTKLLGTTKDRGGGGGGRYERQRQHREELLAAASRRDRPGRRSPFKVSSGKRGKSLRRPVLTSSYRRSRLLVRRFVANFVRFRTHDSVVTLVVQVSPIVVGTFLSYETWEL